MLASMLYFIWPLQSETHFEQISAYSEEVDFLIRQPNTMQEMLTPVFNLLLYWKEDSKG